VRIVPNVFRDLRHHIGATLAHVLSELIRVPRFYYRTARRALDRGALGSTARAARHHPGNERGRAR
jgi:hypothetical protein